MVRSRGTSPKVVIIQVTRTREVAHDRTPNCVSSSVDKLTRNGTGTRAIGQGGRSGYRPDELSRNLRG